VTLVAHDITLGLISSRFDSPMLQAFGFA